MTDEEFKAVRELVYISKQIATTMAACPDLIRLHRAIAIAGLLAFPAWDHRHADEITR